MRYVREAGGESYREQPTPMVLRRLAGPGGHGQVLVEVVLLGEGDQVGDPQPLDVGGEAGLGLGRFGVHRL